MKNLQMCLLSFIKPAKVSEHAVSPSMSGAASALNKIHATRLKTLQKSHDALRKHNDKLLADATSSHKDLESKQMEHQKKLQEAQDQVKKLTSEAQATSQAADLAASQASQASQEGPVAPPPVPPPSQVPYPGMNPGQEQQEQQK